MKKELLLKKCLVVIGAICMTGMVNTTMAQKIVVDNTGLDVVYNAIVAHPGDTIVLKRGELYYNTMELLINVPTVIMGETTPADMSPAVLNFSADPGAASGKSLIKIAANLVIKDIGLMGFTFDDQQISIITLFTADACSLVMDGCIIQGANEVSETNGHNGVSITHKNCKFFNVCTLNFDNWGGYGSMWGGTNVTYKSINNTWFEAGRIFNCASIGPDATEIMNHNTYVNVWGELYYPDQTGESSFTCTNNIAYNPDMRGYVGPRLVISGSDTIWKYDGDFSDFIVSTLANPIKDSLQGDICLRANHTDSTTKGRDVVIKNNARFTDEKTIALQRAASACLQPFLNDSMMKCVSAYGWTYSNNIDNVDPQFEMGALPDSSYTYQKLERLQRSNAKLRTAGYPFTLGWWPNGVTKGTFIWPLPFSLKPTNPALPKGDDGYPLGDLNWYGAKVLADWIAGNPYVGIAKREISGLNLTNYPNPAGYTTTVTYKLATAGIVSLKVYNAIGMEVATLVNTQQTAGQHFVDFNTSGLTNGLYFCKLEMNGSSTVHKMMVQK